MKSQIRCILFALIAVPAAACGGDRSMPAAPVAAAPVRVVEPPVVAPAPVAVAPVAALAAPVDVAPTTFDDAMARGKASVAAGDLVHARAMFEAASKLDKKSATPYIELARVFIARGERGLAVAAAHKAVKRAPASSQAHNTLGRAELARWSYDDAIAAFRTATELDAGNVWAWNNLGLVYLQLKQYGDAAEALVEATRHPGAEGYMWNNLGTAYEHLDQLDEARAAFEAGGKAGSTAAIASRKRLEGVESIAIVQREVAPTVAAPPAGYDIAEEAPPVEPDTPEVVEGEGSTSEPEVEDAVTPAAAVAAVPQVMDAEDPPAIPDAAVEAHAAPETL